MVHARDGVTVGAELRGRDPCARGGRAPVSYTHLDVYKRQDHGQTEGAGPFVDRRAQEADDEQQQRADRVEAVSYTHLPGGVIATTDLGLDLVRFWTLQNGELRETQGLALPRGSGPRHTCLLYTSRCV